MDNAHALTLILAFAFLAFAVLLALIQSSVRTWRKNRERWWVQWRERSPWSAGVQQSVNHSTQYDRRPPLCLEALGLDRLATADDVVAAYRHLALDLHPDRGGDPDEFKRLHRNFEQAMAYAEARSDSKPSKPR